jgi:uncharacterized protein YaeQ
MARTATIYRFDLDIADVDRNRYATVELRVAQHPSESEASLVTRVIAWCLEHDDDLRMGRGIAHPEEATLSVVDPTGQTLRWIEVGAPSAERLHKAAKSAPYVLVVAHRSLQTLALELRQRALYRGDEIELIELPPLFIDGIAAGLQRTNRWSALITEQTLYLTTAAGTLEGIPVPRQRLTDALAVRPAP